MLVRVVAPHFVAGLIIEPTGEGGESGVCVAAAPILRWCVWREADWLRAYFARKGWKATVVTP